jgi:hypothetical protein
VAQPGSSSKVSGTIKVAAGVIAVTTAMATAATAATAAPASVHLNSAGHLHIYRSTLTPAQIKTYSANPDQRVIVLLRDQFSNTLGGGTRTLATRAETLGASQHSLLQELTALHAPNLKHYSFLNAVSASVSSAEAARLKSDPAVRAVVPDSKIALAPGVSTAAPTPPPPPPPPKTLPVNKTAGICGTANKPLLQPEALRSIAAQTAHHGTTGKGVKVAVFPDGLDPNIKDFIRPNGSHAIFDYRDFSGDGPNGLTGAGEAFGDASSIISQGRQTFDISKFATQFAPLPKPCDIRIKGVAPGASLAVMKVFGAAAFTFTTNILQGMDWAVSHDHVNVLSQSFGGNPTPEADTDPISVLDEEAIAHGISVIASSGDAGVTNTIGSPASAKGVIGVGATADFAINAALSIQGYQLGGNKGFERNNVAAFSSTGFTDVGPNTVDVVAPGEGGWADCSTKVNIFVECANPFGGGNLPIEEFGGTSESAPFTAGVVALVIQAYKAAHHGTAPSPAVVKEIVTSSATNLHMQAQDQGAGQVNAARAVELARSFRAAKKVGSTLAIGSRKIVRRAAPGSSESAKVKVTNEGQHGRKVSPTLRAFGPAKTLANATLAYTPAAHLKTFTYYTDGQPEPYAEQDFTVPAGEQRLVAKIGWKADPTDANQVVIEELFDPLGRIAANNDPQGASEGFGQVEADHPMPGTWRAIYISRPGSDKYDGNITTSITAQKLVTVPGAVSPAHARLKAGASKSYRVHFTMPAAAGDGSSELSFGNKVGGVPILMRAKLEPTVTKPSSFTAELTTGNGRMSFPGQELSYAFTVPKGVKDIDADIHVADPGYQIRGTLADPHNVGVDVADSDFVNLTTADSNGVNPDTQEQTMHLSWQDPTPGLWTLDFGTVNGSTSGKVSSPVTGTVSFNTVNVTSANVPNSASTMLNPDATRTATITVKNTGNSPAIYYVDPRLAGTSEYSLGFLTSPNGTLPLGNSATNTNVPEFLVPPASTSMTAIAHATHPVDFTTSPTLQTPEIPSTTGTTAVATLTAPDVMASTWGCGPTLVGPFSSATKGGKFSCAAFALTRTIDDTISATGGNLWDSSTDPNSPNTFDPTAAHVVQPGASTILTVHITPTEDEEGATLSGYLSVQTLDLNFSTLSVNGDDLIHIPYRYTVATPPPAP